MLKTQQQTKKISSEKMLTQEFCCCETCDQWYVKKLSLVNELFFNAVRWNCDQSQLIVTADLFFSTAKHKKQQRWRRVTQQSNDRIQMRTDDWWKSQILFAYYRTVRRLDSILSHCSLFFFLFSSNAPREWCLFIFPYNIFSMPFTNEVICTNVNFVEPSVRRTVIVQITIISAKNYVSHYKRKNE